MKQNATMVDVAKAAGVSIGTVGRVLHNNGYCSEAAREKVERAIAELGYVPNQMARSLKRKDSRLIGVFVLQNPNNLYQRINRSIAETIEKAGYELITLESINRSDDEKTINRFISMHVNGLVIVSHGGLPHALLERLHHLTIPIVAVEREYDLPFVDNIIIRDREGSFDAVKHILDHGHKRIALIASELFARVEEERYQGYISAMNDAGLAAAPELIRLVRTYSPEYGYEAMKQLMALDPPPTAVFCTADRLASGAMRCLYEQGIRIPDAVSIVGYDNVLSQSLAPQIDSVDLDLDDIGEKVLNLLKLRFEDLDAPARVMHIATKYVDRNSVRDL